MTYSARELEAIGRKIDPRAVELRRWRRERCLSQQECGAVLGVNWCQLGRVETGVRALPKYWVPLIEIMYRTWTPDRMSGNAKRRLANRMKARGLADPRQLWIPGTRPSDPPFGAES